MRTIRILGLGLLAIFSLGFGQSDAWELRKDKDGIKVYTQKIAGAPLDAFKGTGVINAPLAKVLRVLRDGNAYTEWSPDCAESVQKESSETRQVNYSVTDAPFPVSDRDSYVEFTYQPTANGMKIILKALPDYGPQVDGMVRLKHINGFWLLEKQGENATRVTYQMQADPGGSIPAWLANATAVDQPFESIKGLRARVK